MATINGSGRVASSWSNSYGLFFEWNANRNIAGNYSDITAVIYADFITLATISVGARSDGKIAIGGQEETVYMPAVSKLSSGTTKIKLGTLTKRIKHNSDGTLPNVSIKAVWPIRANITIGGVTTYRSTIEGTFSTGEITRIPRSSEILSSVDFTLENNLNITLKRYSDEFKHDITLKINDVTYKTLSNIDTSETITLTSTDITNLYNASVNSNSLNTELIVVTKQSETTIGTTTKKGKMYIDSIKNAPTLSDFEFKCDSKTTLTTGWNDYITTDNNLSISNNTVYTIKPSTATFKNGATFKRYEVALNNKTYQSTLSEFTLPNPITYSDNLIVVVVDSRGFKTQVVKNITVQQYTDISLETLEIDRNGYPNQTQLNFNIKGKIFKNSTVANALTVNYRYKETSASDYGSWISLTNEFVVDASGNFEKQFIRTTFDANKSYDVQIKFADIFKEKEPFQFLINKYNSVFEVSETWIKFNGYTLFYIE